MNKARYKGFRIISGHCSVYVRPAKSQGFKDIRVFDTIDEALEWIDKQNIRLSQHRLVSMN